MPALSCQTSHSAFWIRGTWNVSLSISGYCQDQSTYVDHLEHFRPLLLLGYEEGEGAELVVGDDGAPARGVGDSPRLQSWQSQRQSL